MGMNADADLVFGVDCGVEEGPWVDEEFAEDVTDNGDLEEGLLKQVGLEDPRDTMIPAEIREGSDYSAYREYCDSNEELQAALKVYNEKRHGIMDACPFELVYYGSHEFSSYVVYVKGFRISGDWEKPREVKPDKLVPPDADVLKACAEYAKKYGIKWGEPAWLLSASWG